MPLPTLGPALIVGLALYNNVLTAFRPTAWVQATLNLTAAIAALAVARWSGLSWAALGLAPPALGEGAAWGGLVAVTLALGFVGAVRSSRIRVLFRDHRHEGLRGRELATATMFRIPLGTSIPEEVLFRGALLAVLAQSWGVPAAVLVSSLVFGVSHVVPALRLLEAKGIHPSYRRIAGAIAGVVAVTTAGGVGFCLLRLVSGSLLAPVLVHAAINSLSAAGAALHARHRATVPRHGSARRDHQRAAGAPTPR